MSSTPEAIRTQILDLVKEYHTAKFAPKAFDPEKDLVHYAGRVFDDDDLARIARQFIAKRKENFRKLTQILKPCEDRLILPRATENSDPSWFGYLKTP